MTLDSKDTRIIPKTNAKATKSTAFIVINILKFPACGCVSLHPWWKLPSCVAVAASSVRSVPLRSSTKKRLNQPRPRWCRRESTEVKNGWSLPGNVRVVFVWTGSRQEGGWRTHRYFSSWHQAYGTAGCAIAHWRDASAEKTIIVVPNSSGCLLCVMMKRRFCSKNRSTTHNCSEADVMLAAVPPKRQFYVRTSGSRRFFFFIWGGGTCWVSHDRSDSHFSDTGSVLLFPAVRGYLVTWSALSRLEVESRSCI